MSFVDLAKKALEARARLFEEYKAVNDDTKLTDAEKRERLDRLNTSIEERGEEVRDFTAKAEAEAENRNLGNKLSGLFVNNSPENGIDQKSSENARQLLVDIAEGKRNNVEIFGESRAQGANVQTQAGTVGNPTWAGNTTYNQFIAQVLESIRERSPFLKYATIFSTSSGENLVWPVKNTRIGPTNVTAGMNEGDKIQFAAGSFGTTTLGAKKYGVGTQLSYELMTDSEVDIVSIVAQDAGEAISDRLALDMLAKMQAAVPAGKKIVMGGPAASTAVSYANLIDTYHALRTAYRGSAAWYMGDLQLAAIRKLSDTQGHPLWQPALTLGAPDILLGRPVYSDATLTNTATAINTDVLWFGDYSWFKIRQVRGITISRSDEYAWDSDMTSWKVTWRGDGALMDLQAVSALRTAAS